MMSGFIEKYWDNIAKKYLPMLSPELAKKSEIALGMQHFWMMLAVTMSINTFALLVSKWIAIVSILSVGFIVIAEWPPEGRKVDIITRGLGWLFGSITAIIILFSK